MIQIHVYVEYFILYYNIQFCRFISFVHSAYMDIGYTSIVYTMYIIYSSPIPLCPCRNRWINVERNCIYSTNGLEYTNMGIEQCREKKKLQIVCAFHFAQSE